MTRDGDVSSSDRPPGANSSTLDWLVGVAAHVLTYLASGGVALGVVLVGGLFSVGIGPRPTSGQKKAFFLVMLGAALVVLIPQVLLVRTRSARGARGIGARVSAALAAAAVVAAGLVGAAQVAGAAHRDQAAAREHAELAGLGLVLYRPAWVPAGYERFEVRASGGTASVTYAPPPKTPNFPAYILDESAVDSPEPRAESCPYGEGEGPLPTYRCRAIDRMPTGEPIYTVSQIASNQATLTVRLPRTVVSVTGVWEAASDRQAMLSIIRSLRVGSPV